MTTENHDKIQWPDLISKYVTWEEKSQTHKALIDSQLNYGATSFVFKATSIGANNLPVYGKEYAVKVPRPSEALQAEGVDPGKYQDEFTLLSEIAARKDPPNVTRAFKGEIEGTTTRSPVMVMELLDKRKTWHIIEDDSFLKGEILEAASQALDVVDFLARKCLINTDIKDENFFWFSDSPGRFVWLDFNRVIKIPEPNDKTRDALGQQIRNSLYKLLAVLYTAYTGQTVPSPLPLIGERESQNGNWGRFPRPLRAALRDAEHNSQYSISDLRAALEWAQKLQKPMNDGNWKTLMVLAKNAKNEPLEVIRRIEKIRQVIEAIEAIEAIPSEADVDEQVKSLTDWIDKLLKSEETTVKANINTAIENIKNSSFIAAKETLSKILEDPKLPNTETWKWEAACWYAVANMFRNQRETSTGISTNTIPGIVDSFATLISSPSGAYDATKPVLPVFVDNYYNQLATAQGILSKKIPALRAALTSADILEKYIDIENGIKILAEGGTEANLPALPGKTIVVLRNCVPYLDIKELKKAVTAQGQLEALEQNWQDAKFQLEKIFSPPSSQPFIEDNYPEKAITDILSDSSRGDRELDIFRDVHKCVIDRRWSQAFDKLGLIRSEMTLLDVYHRALIRYAKQWVGDFLEDTENTLYFGDIHEIKHVIEIVEAKEGNTYAY